MTVENKSKKDLLKKVVIVKVRRVKCFLKKIWRSVRKTDTQNTFYNNIRDNNNFFIFYQVADSKALVLNQETSFQH